MDSEQRADGVRPDRDRREFLGTVAAVGAAAALGAGDADAAAAPAGSGAPQREKPGAGGIPRRDLGRTGERVSILGMGGHHLGDIPTVEEAIRAVHEAIDAGVNFFDNCWEYYNGRTENWLGRALKGRRERVFLMTKVCTHGRGADVALKMLDQSLRRLGTDRLELWQIHGVSFDNDPDLAYAKGGVLEALDRAKKQGKVRFTGFTGHKDPAVHLRMLKLGYSFDTVQMPLNPFDGTFRSFEREVLPEVNRRKMGALGMKSLGGTAAAIRARVLSAEEALRYAMSLPVATTITGIDSLEVLRQNVRVATAFKPLTAEQMQALRDRCARYAADGRYELYKVSLKYDNPMARLPHGFPIDDQIKEVKEMFAKPFGTWTTL